MGHRTWPTRAKQATLLAASVLSLTFLGDAGRANAAVGAADGCVAASGAAAPPQFLIGVWQQPNDSFAKWRSRGVNTIVDDLWLQTTDSFSKWEQDLACQDLYAIRPPEQPLNLENADPRLLALAQQDEPEHTDTPAADVQSLYRQWKAGAPAKPVFINFSAGDIYEQQANLASLMGQYSGWIAGADWISEDIYPVSGYNRPYWIDLSMTADPPAGFVEDLLQQWSSGKPQYAFIEASNQSGGANYRAPTPDELRGEVWDAIVHGARGIFYFPQAPNVDDGMPPELVTEMTNLDAQLSKLAPLLIAGGSASTAPPPFEAATRTYCGVTYTVTLNFSHNPASYAGSSFDPYQVKISPDPPGPLPTCSSAAVPDKPRMAARSTGPTAGLSTGLSIRAAVKRSAPVRRSSRRTKARTRCTAPTRRRASSPRSRKSCPRNRTKKCVRSRACRKCTRKRSSRKCAAAKRKAKRPAHHAGRAS